MNDESWQQYLYTAESQLDELTTDQIATTAKILALQLGKCRPGFGDFAEEVYQKFLELEEMTEEAKENFKMGMEVMLSVIKQVETVDESKEI
ncbi:MAG: hypothetical protein ACR2PU_00290 [Gammaproteobacteria bacterium]